MLLQDLKDKTARVTVIPSFSDRLLVETKHGVFTIMSVENFIGMMVDAIKVEVNCHD